MNEVIHGLMDLCLLGIALWAWVVHGQAKRRAAQEERDHVLAYLRQREGAAVDGVLCTSISRGRHLPTDHPDRRARTEVSC